MKRYLPATILLLSLACPAFAETSPDEDEPPPRVENTTVPGTGPLPVPTAWVYELHQIGIPVPVESDGVEVDLKKFYQTFNYPGPIMTFTIETGPAPIDGQPVEGAMVEDVSVQLYYADPFPEEEDFLKYDLPDDDDDSATPRPTLSTNIDFMARQSVTALLFDAKYDLLDDSIFHGLFEGEELGGNPFHTLLGGRWAKSQDTTVVDLVRIPETRVTDSREDTYTPKSGDFLYIVPPSGAEAVGKFYFNLQDSEAFFGSSLIAGRILSEGLPAIFQNILEWEHVFVPGFTRYQYAQFQQVDIPLPLQNYTQDDVNAYKPVKWENYARITNVEVSNQTDDSLKFKFDSASSQTDSTGITVVTEEIKDKEGVVVERVLTDGILKITLDQSTLRPVDVFNYFVNYEVKVAYGEAQERLTRFSHVFHFYSDLAILAGSASRPDSDSGYWNSGMFGRIYSPLTASSVEPATDGVWNPGEWFWSDRHGYIYPAVTQEQLHERRDLFDDGVPTAFGLHQDGFWFFDHVPGKEDGFGWVFTSVNIWPTFYSDRFGEWLAYMGQTVEAVTENDQTSYVDSRRFWSWNYREGVTWGGYVTPALVDGELSLVKWVKPVEEEETTESGQ